MTDAKTPPGPDDMTEEEFAEQALGEAERAVHLLQTRQPGAHLAFLKSWLAMLSGVVADAEEGKHRSLAWERADKAEGKLGEIATILSELDHSMIPPKQAIDKIRKVIER